MIGCGANEGIQTVPSHWNDTGSQGSGAAPAINHTPVEAAQVFGEDVTVEAAVNDADGDLFVVRVYYRTETSTEWSYSGLSGDAKSNFSGVIAGADVESAGMYYYLYAMDNEQNETLLPVNGDSSPWHFRVALDDTGQ
jgi:hypothetical protein